MRAQVKKKCASAAPVFIGMASDNRIFDGLPAEYQQVQGLRFGGGGWGVGFRGSGFKVQG